MVIHEPVRIVWANMGTIVAIAWGASVVFLLAVLAMVIEDRRQEFGGRGDAFAFDFYRGMAAGAAWWAGTALMLIKDPSIGAMALEAGRYTIASGTAMLAVGHLVASSVFLLGRLKTAIGWHEWQAPGGPYIHVRRRHARRAL